MDNRWATVKGKRNAILVDGFKATLAGGIWAARMQHKSIPMPVDG